MLLLTLSVAESGDGVMLSSFLTGGINSISSSAPEATAAFAFSDFFFTLTGLLSCVVAVLLLSIVLVSSSSRLTLDATLESAPMLVGVLAELLVPIGLVLVDMFGSVLVDELGVTVDL